MTVATGAPGPFGGEPIVEIPLGAAPLVRVLAQVRFHNMAIFKRPNFIGPFVEALLDQYPLLEEGREMQLMVGPDGLSQQDAGTPIWKLQSLESDWTVTLTPGSLAIETRAYDSRSDFVRRFREMCDAFVATVGRSKVGRLGVRYTNQVSAEEVPLERLIQFIRPEARGGLSIPSGTATLQHGINDALFSVEARSLQARWGILPPNAAFDPSLQAMAQPSWFLDIDCFSASEYVMSADRLESEAATLAESEYQLFRWLVTDEFIDHFQKEKQ